MIDPVRLPPPVVPGDRVGVAALSGAVDPARLDAGLEALCGLGFEPVEAANLRRRAGLFAGTESERLDAFHELAADPGIKAILFARGGWGVLRLLDDIDWGLLARHPRAYVGYSDLTPFLAAVVEKLHLAAFHGPMVAADLARGLTSEEERSLLGALKGDFPATLELGVTNRAPEVEKMKRAPGEKKKLAPGNRKKVEAGGSHRARSASQGQSAAATPATAESHPSPGSEHRAQMHCPGPQGEGPQGEGPRGEDSQPVTQPVTGPLLGGCLSLLVSVLGTPWAADLDASLLFLEDLDEPPYRFDRMLTHLRLSGTLTRIRGLIVGHLRAEGGREPTAWGGEVTLGGLLEELATDFPWPLATGLPAGHASPNLTLPLGLPARLEPTERSLIVGLPWTDLPVSHHEAERG